jgi:hypothetical protein
MIENDTVRHAILEYLYEVNSKARGAAGSLVGIRRIQSSLKEKFNYKLQLINSNINSSTTQRPLSEAFA